ncbi:helix-turn-helix domain-containing protein [Actinocorallia longicatena]|uniref:Helix-turn-helix domain-containing protein n=1 Tax=Actinocorallia longicatena TaxID=111803 RepID=A0ABP6Q1W5_9ACTN
MSEAVKKGERLTGDRRDQLAKDLAAKYASGQSIRQLAAETGRSYGAVHRLLVDHGVNLRSRGGARRTAKAS